MEPRVEGGRRAGLLRKTPKRLQRAETITIIEQPSLSYHIPFSVDGLGGVVIPGLQITSSRARQRLSQHLD